MDSVDKYNNNGLYGWNQQRMSQIIDKELRHIVNKKKAICSEEKKKKKGAAFLCIDAYMLYPQTERNLTTPMPRMASNSRRGGPTLDTGVITEARDTGLSASYFESIHYWNNPPFFQALFQITPSEDEMHCYRELMAIMYDEHDTRSNTVGIGGMTTFLTAMMLLRKDDNAIAHDNRGWIFAIDNILSVLLYRDHYSYYLTNWVGGNDNFFFFYPHMFCKLQLSFTMEVDDTSNFRELQNRNVLYLMKEAIVKGYKGIPSLTGEEDTPDIPHNDIILRDKKILQKYSLNTRTQVHMTFGIRVNDSQRMHRHKPQLVFQHIAIKLSRHILDRRSFMQMFQNHIRGTPFRLVEIKPSELYAFPYQDYVPSMVVDINRQISANIPDTIRTNTEAAQMSMQTRTYSAGDLHGIQESSFHFLSNYRNTQHGNFTATDVKREFSKAFQGEELMLDTEQYVSKIIERNMVCTFFYFSIFFIFSPFLPFFSLHWEEVTCGTLKKKKKMETK
ncbi:hypothetical protein RFI_18103 [Reticulomyxa filosa]|uniref:Uncharacterized protein n=1 Tax=Reticulomyxa filosa TaxID=46433 RepID=X6MZ82_RETFI|nr:hypothetical protein RFI_18103 [Reticulomyxa filosa]|eukprot:ETO19136.1 hypothetical protein RFI_18103 [Reticulomyxa filosa]